MESPPCPRCDQPDATLLRLVLIGELLVATDIQLLRLVDIALGGTYQIHTPFGRNCPVSVDAIDVHHIGEYQCLEQVWETALVWVHELPGGVRYPVSLQAFRPV